MSNPRYGSGRSQFIGQGVEADLTKLDPAAYPGAVVYSEGELYYSDGSEWVVPQDEVDISRPRNLAPTNGLEQAQLRLSAFRSPTGESQTGIIFEFNADGLPSFTEEANVETRIVTSEVASLYDVLYPDDGFAPGDIIWWRARYLGTNGTQSQYSLPTAQTFPDLITTPTPITPQNAITGSVALSAYESAPVFGLEYLETQVEFYAVGDEPGVDTPIITVTQTGGAVTSTPIPPLVPGESYQWRGRYGGRANAGAPTVYSDWSVTRTIFLGAASIVLEYDLTLMIARTIYVPINSLGNPLKPLNVTVYWGDGTSNTYTTAGIKTKTYAAGFAPANNKVIVTISGQMDWYGTTATINQSGLVRVENIGFQMGLESLRGAFRGTQSHLTYITPNLPETVVSLQEAFHSSACAANLSGMDTRNIQNMRQMFYLSVGAGPNCAGWDVRSVTDVYRAFGSSDFNSPFSLGNWESLTSMAQMFVHVESNRRSLFNQPIDYWDVSNITDMSYMFGSVRGANAGPMGSDFNQPIGSWNVSNVVTFEGMFGHISSDPGYSSVGSLFNQPLNTWDTSAATNMSRMFSIASAFNQPIGSWNVSNVTNMSFMFAHLSENAPDIIFNQPIETWDVSSVTNFSGMFLRNYAFNQPLAAWNTSSAVNMKSMFSSCPFNQPIGDWDVSGVTDMSYMFCSVSTSTQFAFFNQDIGGWDVSNVTNMAYMFAAAGLGNSQRAEFNNGGSPTIANWNTSKVTNMAGMFRSGDTDNLNPYANSYHRFNQPIGSWDVSSVTTMQDMFRGNLQAFNQDLSGWNLRAEGVNLSGFMQIANGRAMSQENYSRTLTSWSNKIADVNSGPFAAGTVFGGLVYNTTPYQPASRFTNAAAARAYLVAARALSVSGSSDANGDGSYPLNSATGAYINSLGWYFLKSGSTWTLYAPTNAAQATGDGNFPWEVVTWTGVLSAATVLSSGAGWTITGDAAA